MRFFLLLSVLAATPLLAEGRNDPFLKCRFDGGRQIVLAERGDAVAWIEDGSDAPATIVNDAKRGLVSVTALIHGRGAEFLTFVSGKDAENKGAAKLVSGVFLRDGQLTTQVTTGTCEEFFG